MKSASAAEREAFAVVITAANLERMWWITVATAAISVAAMVYNALGGHVGGLFPLQIADQILTALFLFLIWTARRRWLGERFRRGLVLAFIFVMLIIMDAYFFGGFVMIGHNSIYAIGAVLPAVLILMPPGRFIAILLANHAVYVAGLLAMHRGQRETVSAVFDGSLGVLVAALASWFLYTAAWGNFRKENVIAQRNRQLAASNKALTALNAEMNDLMAVAAHDLRSPLQSQRSLLELMRSRLPAENRGLAIAIETASASCGEMIALVSRLLEAHAAEHRAGALSLRSVDLRAHFAAAAGRMRPAAAAKSILLDCALPEDAAMALADAGGLDQVLDNLLANAVKFSPPGARVELGLRAGPGIWIGEVRDRGPGIPEEERGGLFRKFHRGSAQPTAGEPSTGLGLFIVRTFVEAMRGRVSYMPGDPGGAIFRFEIPRS